ncbi:Transcription Factor IIF, Rap30/Rap74, interaction [Phytophthora cactorum]|nr:Transcription Factor IIF, Rap30/Rap74, interaction [Phytophthora cactorum]
MKVRLYFHILPPFRFIAQNEPSSPARNGRNGRTAASSTSDMETLVLRATPSIKRYNIARFDVPELPRFSSCAQPVMMYREPERVDEEEEKEDEAPVGYNPALRKRRRRRRKDTRTAGWVIEDSEGKNKFNGTFEGGQSSTYMLLVKNRHNDEFSVIPVEQWFRFKKPLNYRTLTLEEAEEMNNEKKRAVERWLMKHKLAGEDKNDAGGDTVSAPRVRTGALATASAKPKAEGDDMFGVTEARPRRVARPKARVEKELRAKTEVTLRRSLMTTRVTRRFTMTSRRDWSPTRKRTSLKWTGRNGEVDGDRAGYEGLAQARAERRDVENNKDKEDDDDDEEDDNFTAKDMDVIKRDLGGNIIRDRSTASGDTSATGDVKAGAGATDGNAADSNGKTKSTAAASASVTGKRKEDDSRAKEDTPAKAAKTSAASKLTEAGVQQELIRYGGRMRTRDLLRKLKKLIVTDNDKALLKDILRTICDVEVDAIDGRLLVLKSQFR